MTPGGQADWVISCGITDGYLLLEERANWLGDGGLNGKYLFQVGTETNEWAGVFSYSLWWENRGLAPNDPGQATINPPSGHGVNCNDHIHVAIEYNCYYVSDYTNGWGAGTTCPSGPNPDYNSLEVIAERPDHTNQGVFRLPATSSQLFYNMQIRAHDTSWWPFYDIGATGDYSMWSSTCDCGHLLMTHDTALGWDTSYSNDFYDFWQNSQ